MVKRSFVTVNWAGSAAEQQILRSAQDGPVIAERDHTGVGNLLVANGNDIAKGKD